VMGLITVFGIRTGAAGRERTLRAHFDDRRGHGTGIGAAGLRHQPAGSGN
jgi:hypothetical protein